MTQLILFLEPHFLSLVEGLAVERKIPIRRLSDIDALGLEAKRILESQGEIAAFIDAGFAQRLPDSLVQQILSETSTFKLFIVNSGKKQFSDIGEATIYAHDIKVCLDSRILWSSVSTWLDSLKSSRSFKRVEDEHDRVKMVDLSHRSDPHLDTEIGALFARHISEFASSIHNDGNTLNKTYVQILDSEAFKVVSGKEVKQLGNSLNLFNDVLFVPNRRTCILLGDRGCGKTTFLHYFFKRSSTDKPNPKTISNGTDARQPKVWHCFVNFLRYNFVGDAHHLTVKTQELVFEKLKSRSQLPPEYSGLEFADFVRRADYDPTDLLDLAAKNQVDISAIKSLLEDLFDHLSDDELLELYRKAEGRDCDVSEARKWKIAGLAEMPSEFVCRMVAFFGEQSRKSRGSVISEAVLSGIAHSDEYKGVLSRFGVDPANLSGNSNIEIKTALRSCLNEIAKNSEVVVVVDNADRTNRQNVELQIFRAAWQYFSECHDVRLVFSMRRSTYHNHGKLVEGFENSNHDIAEYAILSKMVLSPPD
ncbi:MAG: hypothetical protein AAF456_11215, partial [Planctomycetota bacterium]